MSIDLTVNFFKLLRQFRRKDLVAFRNEHERLYKEAKDRCDYVAVTSHYYSVMSDVINDYFNGNFHFVPPSHPNQTLNDALRDLHARFGTVLNLRNGSKCVDIGCGIGGIMSDLSETGAELIGITVAANEVTLGNQRFERDGLENCRIIQGNCNCLPLLDETCHCAYAVYALKYLNVLAPTLREVNRVLRPGGLFLVYDLLKTDKYDDRSVEHRKVVEDLEYACGMPSLHTRVEMVDEAKKCGFELIESADISVECNQPFHYCLSNSPLFMWLIRSSLVNSLISIAEVLRILPKGFLEFKKVFLSCTINSIVRGGELGILNGSEILVFRKVRNFLYDRM